MEKRTPRMDGRNMRGKLGSLGAGRGLRRSALEHQELEIVLAGTGRFDRGGQPLFDEITVELRAAGRADLRLREIEAEHGFGRVLRLLRDDHDRELLRVGIDVRTYTVRSGSAVEDQLKGFLVHLHRVRVDGHRTVRTLLRLDVRLEPGTHRLTFATLKIDLDAVGVRCVAEVLPLLARIGARHLIIGQMETLETVRGKRRAGVRVEDRAVLGEEHGIVVDCHNLFVLSNKNPPHETVQGTKTKVLDYENVSRTWNSHMLAVAYCLIRLLVACFPPAAFANEGGMVTFATCPHWVPAINGQHMMS